MSLAPLASAASAESTRRRPSTWHLAGLGVTAFRDQPQTRMQWPMLTALCLRALLLVSIATAERRVHPAGDAFCLLATPSPRGRLKAVVIGVAATLPIIILVAFLPVVFWLVTVGLIVLLVPAAILSVRTRRPRALLAASAPAGSLVGIHTVASSRPGHGAEVMEMISEEADACGWSLILDAANDRLASYYRRFGFKACGEGVVMPWGEKVVRMVRRPSGALR